MPRERAVAMVLAALVPEWRSAAIHECSPSDRGVSIKLREEARDYTASHYFPEMPIGSTVQGFRNENLERQTFGDEVFDVVITLDVFEHLFDPAAATAEIYRTLKPGGVHICTFPISKGQAAAMVPRARLENDGSITYLAEPQFHGNPISGDGALVTVSYGYDIHQLLSEWAPFDVTVTRYADRRAGILGENTEVVVCRKRMS